MPHPAAMLDELNSRALRHGFKSSLTALMGTPYRYWNEPRLMCPDDISMPNIPRMAGDYPEDEAGRRFFPVSSYPCSRSMHVDDSGHSRSPSLLLADQLTPGTEVAKSASNVISVQQVGVQNVNPLWSASIWKKLIASFQQQPICFIADASRRRSLKVRVVSPAFVIVPLQSK